MADFNDYAPVSKAEAEAAAAMPAAPAPASADAPGPAPAKPRPALPVLLSGVTRSLTIPLAYPLGYAGREYRAITLRRPTSKEVGVYFEALIASGSSSEDDLLFFPVFYDEDGVPVPNVVLANLDDDDRADVMEPVTDFLPRRLLALRGPAPSGSGAGTGADTGPTSSS